MRQITYILCLFIAFVGLASCETYGDYEIEYSSIHPMGGMYRITVTDESGNMVYRNFCHLFNTSDESTTQCWIRTGAYNLSGANAYAINGKISCDLKTLTFAGNNVENLAGNVVTSTTTFSVTDGQVVLQGVTTPSGTQADAISFTFTNSRFPGKTYTVVGYRYTGWSED
ncbi:MAG: hypothetical protein LBQ39_02225 [Tannerellaceae bacterium]|jgi:hypothetical protein|nr:hypothetical protein [Tannerellaceae bacterium]